jgi:oligosaccharyltransferase complex subunit gamma
MRLLSYFTALLCTSGIALSTATKSDKLQQLRAQSRSDAIDLNDATYNDLTSAPRDYHVAVMLTAADVRFGCALCREFKPEWDIIARSWNKAQVSDIDLVFGTLDFSNGKDTFRQVCSCIVSSLQ